MNNWVKDMSRICCAANSVVASCVQEKKTNLGFYLDSLADKVKQNRKIAPLREPDEFGLLAEKYAAGLLGKEAAGEIREALATGVMLTADHHGALFDSQTFQGDLLFSVLLKKLNYKKQTVPVFSGSSVEIGSSTWARGICTYTSREAKQFFAIFPERQRNRLASHCPGIDRQMLERFYRKYAGSLEGDPLWKAVCHIACDLYDNEEIRSLDRFADQVTVAGARLSRELFQPEKNPEAPVLSYLEIEEIIKPLLLDELREEASLPAILLYKKAARKKLNEIRTSAGELLSELLFRGVDEKGRKYTLRLDEDGNLTGRDWHGRNISCPADPENLSGLMKERRLVPGFYMLAALLVFERGISWMGGMFQSLYLPDWQDLTAKLLEEIGFGDQAARIRLYDCSGYICGPMFALYVGKGFANTAGPVEMYMTKTAFAGIRQMMDHTSLSDAHLIGLSPMYFDLVTPKEREADWYKKIAEGLYEKFPCNQLNQVIDV